MKNKELFAEIENGTESMQLFSKITHNMKKDAKFIFRVLSDDRNNDTTYKIVMNSEFMFILAKYFFNQRLTQNPDENIVLYKKSIMLHWWFTLRNSTPSYVNQLHQNWKKYKIATNKTFYDTEDSRLSYSTDKMYSVWDLARNDTTIDEESDVFKFIGPGIDVLPFLVEKMKNGFPEYKWLFKKLTYMRWGEVDKYNVETCIKLYNLHSDEVLIEPIPDWSGVIPGWKPPNQNVGGCSGK